MILCVKSTCSIRPLKKPLNWDTGYDSGRRKMVVKYIGEYVDEYGLFHLYLDLASGNFLWGENKLEDYSKFEIVWRFE